MRIPKASSGEQSKQVRGRESQDEIQQKSKTEVRSWWGLRITAKSVDFIQIQ